MVKAYQMTKMTASTSRIGTVLPWLSRAHRLGPETRPIAEPGAAMGVVAVISQPDPSYSS